MSLPMNASDNAGDRHTASELMKNYHASVFETLAILDNTEEYPTTGAAKPLENSVIEAKRWVDENEL